MIEQHDHHCLLTFNGFDWRIVGCRRHGLKVAVMTRCAMTQSAIFTEIDLTRADMDAYCAAALAWDRRQAETVNG